MKFYRISIIVLVIISFVNISQAHRSPEACTGSGLNMSLFTNKTQVYIGENIAYGIDIFNGIGPVPISCDATEIQASITTPDGVVHPVVLSRTALTNTQMDTYPNVVTYTSREQDINSGSLRATATVSGAIHQNDTNSLGGGNQGVNVTVLPPVVVLPPTPTSTPPSVPTPPPDEPVRNRGGRARTPTPPPIVEVVTPIQPIVPIIPIVLPIVPILPNTGINEESRIETPHMFTNFLHFRNTDDDIKLIIPSILIDTTLGVSGISNKGEVEVSSDPSVATWFNESVKIGKKGTSVVSGHYGWKDKKVAVFDKLHQLKVGDKVYIEENNIITSFVVREIKIYSLKDDAKLVFHSDDDKSHLNLITCSGKWDSVNKTYLERLVVFADKE